MHINERRLAMEGDQYEDRTDGLDAAHGIFNAIAISVGLALGAVCLISIAAWAFA